MKETKLSECKDTDLVVVYRNGIDFKEFGRIEFKQEIGEDPRYRFFDGKYTFRKHTNSHNNTIITTEHYLDLQTFDYGGGIDTFFILDVEEYIHWL
jgi:hypothetical protein